jgi:hypothetical protein
VIAVLHELLLSLSLSHHCSLGFRVLHEFFSLVIAAAACRTKCIETCRDDIGAGFACTWWWQCFKVSKALQQFTVAWKPTPVLEGIDGIHINIYTQRNHDSVGYLCTSRFMGFSFTHVTMLSNLCPCCGFSLCNCIDLHLLFLLIDHTLYQHIRCAVNRKGFFRDSETLKRWMESHWRVCLHGVSFDSAAQMARCSCFSPLVRMQMWLAVCCAQ